MQTISLCMIVKNEEAYLKQCLEAARSFVDEIIVVDTGSTDKTKEIAKQFNAKIFDFEWVNDFSKARNFSLSKASKDWILILDADEIISAGDFKNITELIQKREFDAFTLQQINYTNEITEFGFKSLDEKKPEHHGFKGYCLTNIIRLFRNKSKIRFMNPVHESVDSSIKAGEFRLAKTDIKIYHYQEERGNIREKQLKYLEIYEANLKTAPNKAKAHRDLGILYSAFKGQDNKAVYHFMESLKHNGKSIKTYVGLGFAFIKLKRFNEAKDVFLDGIEVNPDEPTLYVGLANVNVQENDYISAISNYKKALRLGYADKESINRIIEKLEKDIGHAEYD